MARRKRTSSAEGGGAEGWHLWLLYVTVPSIFVYVRHRHHGLQSTGDDDATSSFKSLHLPQPSTAVAPPVLRSFHDPVWADWAGEDGQFETLVPPSEVDYSIKNRLPWERKGYSARRRNDGGSGGSGNDSGDDVARGKCDDLLLFMPAPFARNGHGSQLNSYLLAAMVATFLGKAMVVIERPEKYWTYPNGSQFGCPIDAFKHPEEYINFRGNDHSAMEMRRDFPMGLKRLIVHPTWLSRDCGIPTCDGFDYMSWDAVRKRQVDRYEGGRPPRSVTCAQPGGRDARVAVLGGEEVRQFFSRRYESMMLDRTSRRSRERAYDWAVRLGGTRHHARALSRLTDESDIWDFVSALIARSGLVTLQPWIVRDVREFIRSSALPLREPHDAIHVRRGDKLASDARDEVVNYWHSQGYERQVDFPLNYIVS